MIPIHHIPELQKDLHCQQAIAFVQIDFRTICNIQGSNVY